MKKTLFLLLILCSVSSASFTDDIDEGLFTPKKLVSGWIKECTKCTKFFWVPSLCPECLKEKEDYQKWKDERAAEKASEKNDLDEIIKSLEDRIKYLEEELKNTIKGNSKFQWLQQNNDNGLERSIK